MRQGSFQLSILAGDVKAGGARGFVISLQDDAQSIRHHRRSRRGGIYLAEEFPPVVLRLMDGGSESELG